MSNEEQQPNVELEGVGEGLHALVRTLHVLFFCLRLLIVFIFVYLIFSGVFYVKEHEEGMLFHFGKLCPKDGKEVLTSGKWYWAWPYPIDRVKRVEAQRSVTIVTMQFWPHSDANQIKSLDDDQPFIAEGNSLVPGKDGYLLTGDDNIMHLVWTITYRVKDAKRYYLNFLDSTEATHAGQNHDVGQHEENIRKRSAEGVIENLLSSAVLSEVASWPVENVITVSRRETTERAGGSLAAAVKERVTNLVDQVDLGIEVQQVSHSEVLWPKATQAAFLRMNEADLVYRMTIDQAEAYQKRVEAEADGEAAAIIADAEAYRTRVVESVKAEAAYFETVLDEYNKNPETMLVALYTDAIRDVMNQIETKYIIRSKADGRQEIRLQIGPEPKKADAATKPGE